MGVDFDKNRGLVPVIIQDNWTLQVLMMGYMSEESYIKTQEEGKVIFFSRSKNRLWLKGETSGNYLWVNEIRTDCDEDALLIKVTPQGPVCHTGNKSCFKETTAKGFLYQLQNIIANRINSKVGNSYTRQLAERGMNAIAQKVGEEAVELIIEAKDNNDDRFKNEAADLLYHFLVLLQAKNITLEDIEQVLADRSK